MAKKKRAKPHIVFTESSLDTRILDYYQSTVTASTAISGCNSVNVLWFCAGI